MKEFGKSLTVHTSHLTLNYTKHIRLKIDYSDENAHFEYIHFWLNVSCKKNGIWLLL